MSDDLARPMAASDHASDRDRLTQLATRYVSHAQHFLNDVTGGREQLSGTARQLAVDALELAMLAERVEAGQRALIYLAPRADEGAGQ